MLVDKGKPACYDMLTIVRKEEVNMLKNGWNVCGRRLAPEGTAREEYRHGRFVRRRLRPGPFFYANA